jgi:uncharacterized protein YkwD
MKYHFLGTFCTLLAVMGITGTAKADISTSIPTTRPLTTHREYRSTPIRRNSASTPTPGLHSLDFAIFQQVNQYRQSQHLSPLVFDPAISVQAKAHSEGMARAGRLSHKGFNERVDSISPTIIYKSAAENIASNLGYDRPDAVAVKGWIESPGHHHNLIGRYDRTGIGVAQNTKGEYFFTQIFVRKPR